MKLFTLSLILLTSLNLTAQDTVIGRYRTYFGDRLQLNADASFKYSWHFDMLLSWTKGTWSLSNDTILLHMVPTYDTLRETNSTHSIDDSLILSADDNPERIILPPGGPIAFPTGKVTEQTFSARHLNNYFLNSHDQNRHGYPEKLLFRKGKLYIISKGRLEVRRIKGFGTRKKWPPWYFKITE